MAERRIRWTKAARKYFYASLHFYIERNDSKAYSVKLRLRVRKALHLLESTPFIGKPTTDPSLRVIWVEPFNIFYEVRAREIVIMTVWDPRQDPSELQKFF